MKRSVVSIVRNGLISAIALLAALTVAGSASQETPWDLLSGFPAYVTMQTYHDPSIASVMGKTRLFYEIYVLNAYGANVEVASLRVRSGKKNLATFSGDALASMIRPLGRASDKPSRTIAAAETAVFYVELSFDAAHDVPPAFEDELVLSGAGHTFSVTQRPVRVRSAPPMVIGAPLRGDGWFAGDAPANDTGHRRTVFYRDGRPYLAQRFAVDWVQGKLDAQGHLRFFHDDPKKNANWYCWNAPVFAVADGVVVGERTDLPENVPLEPPVVRISQQTLGGNYVVIDIGFGRYAFYAHMRPHSATVKVGDRVRRGQIVGRLGNTGNSTAPHLHFHLTDTAEFIFADGEPYAFATIKAARAAFDSEKPDAGADLTSSFATFDNTMPGNGAVVDFGSGP